MEETSLSMPKSQFNTINILILVLGALILAGLVVVYLKLSTLDQMKKDNQELRDAVSKLQNEVKLSLDAAVVASKQEVPAEISSKLEVGQFNITATSATFLWKGTTISLFKSFPKNTLTNYLGVLDPRDSSKMIFATYEDSVDQSISNTINSYDLKTKVSSKIYEETLNDTTDDIFGVDGFKLVIWRRSFDNSPGPCFSPVTKNNTELFYLDLNDIPAGLRHYEPPTSVLEQVRLEAEQCVKGM